jgi:glycosyltransferase involved in cell wall biosynthesis
MRLLADAQALQDPDTRQRGIGRYASRLLGALAHVDPACRVEAVINGALPAPDRSLLDPAVIVREFHPLLPRGPDSRDANERYFADWLTGTSADAILALNIFEGSVLVPRFTGPRPLVVAVAYDLIPLLFHEHYLADSMKQREYGRRLRAFTQADLVLAISDATRGDVIRLLRWPESRVVTIFGGAALQQGVPGVPDEDAAAALVALGIDRPFLLFVAGADRRKNVAGAVAGFAALPEATREPYLFVVAGALPDGAREDALRLAAKAGVERQLRVTGYVSDPVLHTLYERCRLSLFPSFHEGLGLPVLEALQRGAPVVASDRGAIPECAGPMSTLVDPSSPAEIAAGIQETLREPRDARADERRRFAATFSWAGTAGRAWEAIRQAFTARHERVAASGSRRPRVAWGSPLPPAHSGIADYSAELLDGLEAFDIELVVSPEATVAGDLARRFPVLRPGDVDARHRAAPFDLFVYHLGNSDLHIYMLEMLRSWPGLLVLHDVYLGGLALRATEVGAWPGGLAGDIEAEGASDLAAAVRRGVADHGRIATDVTLSRRVVDVSDAVVVHSGWSWAAVRRHARVPVFRVPMGVALKAPEPIDRVRARFGLRADQFVVATLGAVTRSKRVDRIVQAIGVLPDRIRIRLRLVVVGDVEDALADQLRRRARDTGLGARMSFTGRVPLDDLATFGRAADCCVQLRYPAHGETSAALLRALAAGAACVVSDAGSFSEVPSDAALRVGTGDSEVEDVASALVRLHDDPGLASALRVRGARFVAETHTLDQAAAGYAAAMRLTLARDAGHDGAWRDAAADALARAARVQPIDGAVFERWAEVREAARAPARSREPSTGAR